MTVNEIKKIAEQHHLKPGKANKRDLIRKIQQTEGNLPCFGSNISQACGQHHCLWRADCV